MKNWEIVENLRSVLKWLDQDIFGIEDLCMERERNNLPWYVQMDPQSEEYLRSKKVDLVQTREKLARIIRELDQVNNKPCEQYQYYKTLQELMEKTDIDSFFNNVFFGLSEFYKVTSEIRRTEKGVLNYDNEHEGNRGKLAEKMINLEFILDQLKIRYFKNLDYNTLKNQSFKELRREL